MSIRARLERLEQRKHGGITWCRCPYDAEQNRMELDEAMRTGEPTPAVCARCGRTRIQVQYVDKEAEFAEFAAAYSNVMELNGVDQAEEVEMPEPDRGNDITSIEIPEPVQSTAPAPEPAMTVIDAPQDGLSEWLRRRERERLFRRW